jgi:hypothetical protein
VRIIEENRHAFRSTGNKEWRNEYDVHFLQATPPHLFLHTVFEGLGVHVISSVRMTARRLTSVLMPSVAMVDICFKDEFLWRRYRRWKQRVTHMSTWEIELHLCLTAIGYGLIPFIG